MIRSALTFLLATTICVSSIGFAAEQITVDGSIVTLGEQWKVLSDAARQQSGYDAVWINPKTNRPNAVILGKKLTKSVTIEADEMASSAEEQPEVVKLLEDRKVELKEGGTARIVSLEVSAGNQQLGIAAPMIFHSIYLPTEDEKSVTFKLQCAKSDLESLKAVFEAQTLGKLTK